MTMSIPGCKFALKDIPTAVCLSSRSNLEIGQNVLWITEVNTQHQIVLSQCGNTQ